MTDDDARQTANPGCTVLAYATLVLLLLGACTPSCGPGTSCNDSTNSVRAAADGSTNTATADANAAFALFLNDPTNPESWQWLCTAAASGNNAAQYTVAIRYRDGLPPVERNTVQAYRWFTAAMQNGLTAAALARDELQKSIPDETLTTLQKEKHATTKADCMKSDNGT